MKKKRRTERSLLSSSSPSHNCLLFMRVVADYEVASRILMVFSVLNIYTSTQSLNFFPNFINLVCEKIQPLVVSVDYLFHWRKTIGDIQWMCINTYDVEDFFNDMKFCQLMVNLHESIKFYIKIKCKCHFSSANSVLSPFDQKANEKNSKTKLKCNILKCSKMHDSTKHTQRHFWNRISSF